MPWGGLRGRFVCLTLFLNKGVSHNHLSLTAVRGASPCPWFEKHRFGCLHRTQHPKNATDTRGMSVALHLCQYVLLRMPTFPKLIRGRPDVEPAPIKYYSSELFLCEISTALGTIICPRVIVVELVDGGVVTSTLITFSYEREAAAVHAF